jgi:hypothetical protein
MPIGIILGYECMAEFFGEAHQVEGFFVFGED